MVLKTIFSEDIFCLSLIISATFSVLSKWPVTHRLQDYLCIAPIIELHDPKTSSYIDYGTEVKRVKFSEMNRSPWQPLIAQEHMKEWYEALRKFSKLANSKDRFEDPEVLQNYSGIILNRYISCEDNSNKVYPPITVDMTQRGGYVFGGGLYFSRVYNSKDPKPV